MHCGISRSGAFARVPVGRRGPGLRAARMGAGLGAERRMGTRGKLYFNSVIANTLLPWVWLGSLVALRPLGLGVGGGGRSGGGGEWGRGSGGSAAAAAAHANWHPRRNFAFAVH